MCDHGNNADCTNRKERQEQTVIARIPSQTGFHTLTHGTRDISGGVLDCLDVTELSQTTVGFQLNVQTGAARHIVNDNRLVRGIIDRLVVTEHAFLRRARIVRSDHKHRIGACFLGLLHHAHGVGGIVGTRTGDNGHAHHILDGLNQLDLLLHVGGGRLARGAIDHKAIGAIGNKLLRKLLRGLEINGTIGLHGGDHGRKNTSERSRIKKMHSTVSHSVNGTSRHGRRSARVRDHIAI